MKIKLLSIVMALTLLFSATIPYIALAAETTADSAKNSTSTTGTTAAGEEQSTTEMDEKARHEAQLMLEKQQKELEDNIKTLRKN